jgi:hypothetical protein
MAVVDIAKIVNVTELEAATAAEVAETYESNDDTNKFTDAEQTRLSNCKPIIILTQAEYDAIGLKDTDTLYFIRPEV